MSPGEEIRAARQRAGLTQDELARRSGIRQSNIAAYERGRRRPSDDMVRRLLGAAAVLPSDIIDRHRAAILEAVARHKGSDARVFGSVAAGSDSAGSDVDLLVRFAPDASLFDVVALTEELEQLLGIPVDLLSEGGLKQRDHEITATAVRI